MSSINNKPTGKQVFFWNIVGSMCASLLSMITLMVVARTLDEGQSDIFSLAWAISQMMATIGTFQIRTYQATDVMEKFKFGQYFRFRCLSIAVMMLSSVVYIFIREYSLYKAIVIVLVCTYVSIDAIADIYEGYFQQKERLDLTGKSITSRIIMEITFFSVCLVCTHELLVSCIALCLGCIVSFILFDYRYSKTVKVFKIKEKWEHGSRWILELFKEGFPIFINAFIMMSIVNAPKMEIDSIISSGMMEEGGQTVFNILFMPASVLTLVYIVFRPLLTKLAIRWKNGEVREFLKIILTIISCLLVISVIVLIGAAILGIPLLSLVYNIDLGKYRMALIITVIGGCFCTFSYVLDNAMIIIRKQYLLVCSYVASWVYIKLVVSFMVSKWKMEGAAIAYATSMMIFFLVTLIIFIVCFCKQKRKITK